MDYEKLFHDMHPGFFRDAHIRNLPEDWVYTELVMDLRTETPKEVPYGYLDNITFGAYSGSLETIREIVRNVEDGWVPFFDGTCRIYCAFDNDKIASFCILDDWGVHDHLRIGGPGCVGTLPEYRKRGIGLEMVRRATVILKEDDFDLSWIHYTHVGPWYEKLGYQTVLSWNKNGPLGMGSVVHF